MNKAQKLIDTVDELRFDAKLVLPRVLTSKEMNALASALDNRLDPKNVKSSPNRIVIGDDSFLINVDNGKSLIMIDGDISVKRDIVLALKDIGLEFLQ